MMTFTVKGLIALFVTSSALLLTPMRSDAQVNMKTLAEVTESCQKDVVSESYYQQMLLNFDDFSNIHLGQCIYSRYHYSLILDKFPEIASKGEILPGYLGSVAVAELVMTFGHVYPYHNLLGCIITNNASSNECDFIRRTRISQNTKYRSNRGSGLNYLPYVCPSCVVAHDEVSGSGEVILKAFIKWFLKLDKPQRREVISLLGDEDEASQLRLSLNDESVKAVDKYQETRARVQQQEREQRRRELLGN